ncbi:PQQ-binding-like beta-propeller repeat protein [Micromonospora sp. LOL_024]|uniref:outer membrane protein assembly factor BamB family protein n=1 Tax=Micromonospora sp. LOL_024 TaxID=3345412 RepID=UPI003A898E18
MTFIDLGELTEPTDPPAARRRPRPGSRRLWAAVVALGALLTLAGAAPPARRIHATVPAALGSDLFLTQDQVFTVTPLPHVTDGSQELLAYPRPERATGTPQRLTPRWRVPVPIGNRVYRVESVADGGVLVSMASEATGTSETLHIDARTGQERWRAPGVAILDEPGRALLRTFGNLATDRLRAVELATARELWSIPLSVASVDYRQRDGLLDTIVLSALDGQVVVIDPETGAIRHRLPAPEDNPAGYQQAAVIGDLVVVIRNSNTVTAYTVEGLIRRWRTTVPTATYVTSCGPLLCTGLAGGGLTALDAATGAVRWHEEDAVDVLLTGDRTALVLADDTREMATLDVTTGAVVADHGAWELVARYEYAPRLFAVRQVPDVGLVLARLDPTRDRARPVDVLAGAAGDCRSRYALVACRLHNGDFGVWQLPA